MLLTDHGQPLPARLFFVNVEMKPGQTCANVFDLVVENAGQDHDAMEFQDAMEFLEERGDEIGRQIPQEQISAGSFNAVDRATEGPDIGLAVTFNICPRDL